MAARKVSRSGDGPRSLASVQVDVTARLGAVAPHTTTGLASLDAALGGGLRAGHHLVITGAPGVGKTSLALMLAYIAARARASTLYSAVGLDETEVVARLAARTVHREYEQVLATYGTIWDGSALQEPELRGPLSGAIASVFRKVGDALHLHAAEPLEDVAVLAEQAASLWSRHDRVVVVVDGAEAFSAGPASALPGYDGRVALVGQALAALARHGAAVVTTAGSAAAPLLAPSATVLVELRTPREPTPRGGGRRGLGPQDRAMELVVVKNRLGPTPTVPVVHRPAASVVEER